MTGLHYTELERATSGQGSVRALDGHGEIAGVLEVPHRSGGRTSSPWTPRRSLRCGASPAAVAHR